jgi:hypothetical protein
MATPGARVHHVVHPAPAVRALALKESLFIPMLRPAAPGAVSHRILHPASAPPVTAGIHSEPPGGLEGFVAGVPFLVNVRAAPGAPGEFVRHRPPALVAFGTGEAPQVGPALSPPAVGTEAPVPLHLQTADAALRSGPGAQPPTPTRAHSTPLQSIPAFAAVQPHGVSKTTATCIRGNKIPGPGI